MDNKIQIQAINERSHIKHTLKETENCVQHDRLLDGHYINRSVHVCFSTRKNLENNKGYGYHSWNAYRILQVLSLRESKLNSIKIIVLLLLVPRVLEVVLCIIVPLPSSFRRLLTRNQDFPFGSSADD